MNARLLVAVAHSKAAIPLSANPGLDPNDRYPGGPARKRTGRNPPIADIQTDPLPAEAFCCMGSSLRTRPLAAGDRAIGLPTVGLPLGIEFSSMAWRQRVGRSPPASVSSHGMGCTSAMPPLCVALPQRFGTADSRGLLMPTECSSFVRGGNLRSKRKTGDGTVDPFAR